MIKALQYDREQYDKGYKDGVRETFIGELEEIKIEIESRVKLNNDLENYDISTGLSIALGILEKHMN